METAIEAFRSSFDAALAEGSLVTVSAFAELHPI